MANIRNGNTFYIDSNSAAGTASSFISERNIKVVGIVYHATATTDVVTLYDLQTGNVAGQGAKKKELRAATAGDTQQLRFADAPILFPNGVWAVVTGTPQATLILSHGSKS